MGLASWSSRLNAIFSYFGVVMTVLIIGNVASTYFFVPDVKPVLRFGALTKLEKAPNFDADFAVFTFDLDVDLTPAFHWGTKQIFAYVTAHYKTAQFSDNQVVVWDKLILDKDHSVIREKNRKIKYALRDYATGLTRNDVKLVFSYQVHPVAGLIVDRHFDSDKDVVKFQTRDYTSSN